MTKPPTETALEVITELAALFEAWIERGPDSQPHYANGMRPFSTGDLKHHANALRQARDLLSDRAQSDAGREDEESALFEDPTCPYDGPCPMRGCAENGACISATPPAYAEIFLRALQYRRIAALRARAGEAA